MPDFSFNSLFDQATSRNPPGRSPKPQMAGKRFKALLRGTFKRDRDNPSANSSNAPSRSSTPVQATTSHGSTHSVTVSQHEHDTPTVQDQSVTIEHYPQPSTAMQDAQPASYCHTPTSDPLDNAPTVAPSDHAQNIVAATSIDIAPENGATAALQSFDDPNSLWRAAYRLLQEREPELAAAYADHLLPGSTADALTSSDSVATVVEGLQADREAKQWRFDVRGRSVKVRGQIEKLAKFLVWTDGVVKTAASAQPYAALAWSAISIFIPLLTVGTDLNEAMLEGIESITRVQVFWKMWETSASIELESKDFFDLVIGLYSMIIEYQARVICHLSLRQRSRAWVNVTGGTAWEAEAAKINKVDERCRICLDQTQKQISEERGRIQISEILKSREALEHIYKALIATHQQYDDGTEQNILERLFANHEGYKNDLNPSRTIGTCEWFFQDPRYLRWRDSNESSLLWVSAGPGCGKSVLSRALIDEHRLSTSASTSTICYFFFKDGDERRTTCAAALSAILHQLFIQDRSGALINKAKAAYKNAGKNFGTTPQPLWEILLDCIKSQDVGDIICLIDALDECEEHEREKLVDLLKGFYGHGADSSTKSNLRFIITSRPYDTIGFLFKNLSAAVKSSSAYIQFDGNDKIDAINQEINIVIDEKVRSLPGSFKPQDRLDISRHLKQMQNRSYLWLQLVFRIIAGSPSNYGRPLDINALFEELPAEVSDVYEHILNKSKSDRRKTDVLFHLLLAASQPLTIQEANEALTAALSKTSFESLDDFSENTWHEGFESVVQNLTGFLVVASSEDGWADKTLVFTHQTVREFLTHQEPKGIWHGRYKSPMSQQMMTSTCFRVLSIPNFATSTADPVIYMPFIERYARSQWKVHYDHLNLCQKEALFEDTLNLLQKDLLQRNSHGSASLLNDRPWLNSKMIEAKELFAELGMACFLDLDVLVQKLLSGNTIDINHQREGKATIKPRSSLQRKEFGINYRADSGLSLLHLAVSGESAKVVKLLLDRGADPSLLTTGLGKSPLDDAVARHYYGIAELLVDDKRGIPVHHSTRELLMGWFDGFDAKPFLELLLKNDPDMKIAPKMLESFVNRNAWQLLSVFVKEGALSPVFWEMVEAMPSDIRECEAMIDSLLRSYTATIREEKDENFTLAYSSNSYPAIILNAAGDLHSGHIILGLILKRYAKIEILDIVLSTGASNPRLGSVVAKLLLERGQTLRVPDIYEVSRLQEYDELEYKILELLFDRHPEIGISEAEGEKAVAKQNSDILRLLFERYPDIEITEAVVKEAVTNENPRVLRLLFEHYPDIEIPEAVVKEAVMNQSSVAARDVLEMLFERDAAATVTKPIMWHALEKFSLAVDFFIEKQTSLEILEEFINGIFSKRPYCSSVEQSEALELDCSIPLLRRLLEDHRHSLLVRELTAVQYAKMAVDCRRTPPVFDNDLMSIETFRGMRIIGLPWLDLFTEEEYAPISYRALNCMRHYGTFRWQWINGVMRAIFKAPTVKILATIRDGEEYRSITRNEAVDYIHNFKDADIH